MSQRDKSGDASVRNDRHSGSGHGVRQGSRRRSVARENDKESSSEDKGSPGSWNVDRGRSRTRRLSSSASGDNLRRRGYHALFSSFGKVFHVEKRWKMVRDMGSGAYGVVISAADEISGETVAIKLVTRVLEKVSLAKRALREITLLRHFANHENITGLIDVDAISKDFSEIYLFMEPMEADLHQIIKSGQTLTNEHVQYFVYQILRGMKYVHSASVVHRDLKPGNLLVNADCELKICDFGLSRGFDAVPDEFATHMTEYVATRWYRAPEIMLAFRRYNTAIDVWSIGCIMAELILGKPLFKGKDYVDQLNKILDVLGTPDEDVVKRICSDKAQAYIRSLSYRKTVPFHKIIPSADPLAVDLLTKMLTFDPVQRITVTDALEHPWLASYHDVNDEPICPVPYDKWRAIEELETIEQFREALWNEIEEYRREVRSIVFDPPHANGDFSQPRSSFAPSDDNTDKANVSELNNPTPGIVVEDRQAMETESSTAVDDSVAGEATAIDVSKDDRGDKSGTDTVTAMANQTAVQSPAALRPGQERRDSMRPPTPADMANDPVVHYARRSSILQAQYIHQQAGSASASPVRRAITGLPTYEELREGLPAPGPTPPPVAGAPHSSALFTSGGSVGSIPFPSTGGGSFIVPARSRTASTVGGEHGSGFFGPRKLLRTLSTVSIHESAEGLAGGLAAMGPMGQAIIERRETAADAPLSEMPRDFGTVREEGESHSGSGKSNEVGSGVNSAGPVSSGRKSGKGEDKASTPSSTTDGKESAGGTCTPARKKEKRFIIF
ncbi:hypothetical protein M0805_005135 [Coniferiporia weirii]|nr:hypothetical protein M0805_005135 [Coniferiporia weirii]